MFRSLTRRLRFALLAGCFAIPPTVHAVPADPVVGAAGAAGTDSAGRDWRLVIDARRALLADKKLAGLNLGVSVRDGVATLWGPVPSPDLARRAEVRLRQVTGISDVVSECTLFKPADPLPAQVAAALRDSPLPPDDPLPLVGDPGGTAARVVKRQVVEKPRIDLPNPGPGIDPEERAPGAPVLPPGPPAVLLRPTAGGADLAGTLERVRKSEPRFSGIRLEVRDGVVRVQGSARHAKDAWDLAERLWEVPGVRQVIVGKVAVP